MTENRGQKTEDRSEKSIRAIQQEGKKKLRSARQILLVDDNDALLQLMCELVEQIGCEGIKTASVSEAMKVLEKKTFPLVVTDLRFPAGQPDGLDLLKWVKERAPSTEVILISSFPSQGAAVDALESGASDFLICPFPSNQYAIEVIQRALNRQAQSESLRHMTEEVKHRNIELEMLYKVSNAIGYTLDYEVLMRLVMGSLTQAVPFDLAAFLLIVPERTMSVYLREGIPDRCIERCRKQVVEAFSLVGGVWQGDEGCKSNVTQIPPGPSSEASDTVGHSEQTFYNCPLLVGDRLIGMIAISSIHGQRFEESDVRFVSTAANQMAGAIERIRQIIQSEKSKMEIMVENMVEGVIMIDQKREVVVINPRARKMLGFGTEEVPSSRRVKDRLKTLGLDLCVRECEQEQHIVTKEFDLSEAMGSKCLARCQANLVKDAAGNLLGLALVLTDVTLQKEIDQMKTEFVSIVSHELRTPLSITKEGIALVLDGVLGALNTEQNEVLSAAQNNINRLARLINDLLDVSKLEAGKVELKRKRMNLEDPVREVAAQFAPQVKKKGLELQIDFPSGGVELYADRDHLIQIFVNLVGNALKFTPSGTIRVFARESPDGVECVVADTGIGISKEDLPKVFSKFQQFGRVAGSGAKGTGLGLVIVKQMVELHKGKIRVESMLGTGTTFTFTLPRFTAEELFRERISEPLKRAQGSRAPLSCLLFDFKGFDTRWGKLGRDEAAGRMKGLEEQVKKLLRKNADLVLGENYTLLVILPETQRQDGLKVAERILQVVGNQGALLEGNPPPAEIVYRLATFPEDGETEENLLRRLL